MVTLFFNPRKEGSILKEKSILLLSRYIDLLKDVRNQKSLETSPHWFNNVELVISLIYD